MQLNPTGYIYCTIYLNGESITRRVHRLVAKAFISNPKNLPIVNHKDGNKSNNKVKNLEWATVSWNTKHAFDMGLAKNDKGYEDSQSFPVIMFDTNTNQELTRFGSISEASREINLHKSTIARQCKYQKPARKNVYFRYQ